MVVASYHREVLACASFVAVENDVFHSFSNPTESMEKTDVTEQSVQCTSTVTLYRNHLGSWSMSI